MNTDSIKFADLHCHPHMKSFNWLRHSRYEQNKKLKEKDQRMKNVSSVISEIAELTTVLDELLKLDAGYV